MKAILVATDFSNAGHNACIYARELAGAFNARLILFNSYQLMPVPVPEAPLVIPPDDMRRISREQIEKEAKEINLWKTITVETCYKEGDAVDNILEAARNNKADLIITGMKASGKRSRRILGSTVTALIRRTTIPVVVVPEKTVYTRINTIALANESDLQPDNDVHVVATLYMVRVSKDQFMEAFDVLNPPSILIRAMRAADPIYRCIQGTDLSEGLNSFIKQYHVDMLALLSPKHSLLERWFTKSATREMVFETHVPLLILPGLQKPESREY
jgi:nucleotide-binding universal stress UspA family protein